MTINPITKLGMELEQWTHESCKAEFGLGDDWATLFYIETREKDRDKGYATALLTEAQKHYATKGLRFGGSVALSPAMAHLYEKLGITEYN